jgi:hypothetical protein
MYALREVRLSANQFICTLEMAAVLPHLDK